MQKKKNCLDELNEMFEGTNFILEYYAKKEKNRLDESNEKKNCFENKSNESIKGTNFASECYVKKKKKKKLSGWIEWNNRGNKFCIKMLRKKKKKRRI